MQNQNIPAAVVIVIKFNSLDKYKEVIRKKRGSHPLHITP